LKAKTHQIPVIAGDGIGPEIIAEGKKVLQAAARKHQFDIEWLDLPFGTDYYLKTGKLLEDKDLDFLKDFRAIYLGSLGDPRVQPGLVEIGIILKLRFAFDQYINLRPIYLLDGINSPLHLQGPEPVGFPVIRENTEDFYVALGGRLNHGAANYNLALKRRLHETRFDLAVETTSSEIGFNLGVISREGAERVLRYGFEYARKHGLEKVTAIDKFNVIPGMYGVWREAAERVAREFEPIQLELLFADAVCMWLIKNPDRFQVVVAPNLFGDIVTDLAAAIVGGLGVVPGANINPGGTSMFEPMHGSAPKYKALNRANPIATIWAGSLMLEFLGEERAAECVMNAVKSILRENKVITPDLGGSASTSQVGDAIARRILDEK
jgi:tartrate dehydrogenase/decarboxylase / D-malate dehydrogenase